MRETSGTLQRPKFANANIPYILWTTSHGLWAVPGSPSVHMQCKRYANDCCCLVLEVMEKYL